MTVVILLSLIALISESWFPDKLKFADITHIHKKRTPQIKLITGPSVFYHFI